MNPARILPKSLTTAPDCTPTGLRVPQRLTQFLLKCSEVTENKGVESTSTDTDRTLSESTGCVTVGSCVPLREKPARGQLHMLFYHRTYCISINHTLSTSLRTPGEAGSRMFLRQTSASSHCSNEKFSLEADWFWRRYSLRAESGMEMSP